MFWAMLHQRRTSRLQAAIHAQADLTKLRDPNPPDQGGSVLDWAIRHAPRAVKVEGGVMRVTAQGTL